MDMTESLAPRSDQMNSEDLLTGDRVLTIKEIRSGSADQPFDFFFEEFPRPWRPSKTMRRLMAIAWNSTNSDDYIGKRIQLFRDPSIRFGGMEVGGIRIRAMSGLGKPTVKASLTSTRGKKETHIVKLLPDNAPTSKPISEENVARLAELRAEWKTADPERKKEIEAEVKALEATE